MTSNQGKALLGLIIVVGLGVGAWWCFTSSVTVPDPDLSEINPGVRDLIITARQEVENHRDSAEKWGELGMLFMHHGYPAEAQICFAQAEKLEPELAKWPYLQSLEQEDLSHPEQGLACAKRAAEKAKETEDMPRLRLANLYLDQGNLDEAEKQYRQLLQMDASHPRAQLGLARIHIARQEWPAALKALNACKDNPHASREAHILLAQYYQRTKDFSKAAEVQEKLAKIPADKPWLDPYLEESLNFKHTRHHLLTRYNQMLAQKKEDAAAEALRIAEKTYPELYWLIEGQYRLQRKDFTGAEIAFRKSLELDSKYVEARVALAMAQTAQRQNEEAIVTLDELLKDEPSYGLAHLIKGKCLINVGKEDEALKVYEMAVRYAPLNAEAHYQWGRLLAKHQKVKEARRELEAALRLNPKHKDAQKALEKLPSS